jgi:hypothetical protein
MTVPPESPAPSSDLAGSRFLGSVGVALAVALWGSACGSFVEAAAGSCPEARFGAVLAALLLTGCAAALAVIEGSRFGTKEALGRGLREALRSSWQGAWLGGLIGGAFAGGGGVGLLLLVLAVAAAGGSGGLLLGRLLRVDGRVRTLNLALSLALLGGFVVTALWGAPGTPTLSRAATATAVQESPVFGPAAAWVWTVCAAAPLAVAAVVWGIASYRGDRARGKEPAAGLGWGLAALVFLAALAAGLGAVVGAAAQWVAGQLVLGGALTPTTGKWLGAALALALWGLGRQPDQPTTLAGLKQQFTAALALLLQQQTPPGPVASGPGSHTRSPSLVEPGQAAPGLPL